MKRRVLGFGAIICVFVVTAFYLWSPITTVQQFTIPDLVKIEAGPYNYRPAGDFRIDTRIVDAPIEQRDAKHSFEIMKYHVSQADYAACVADKACYPSNNGVSTTMAQVDVSYIDAIAYANWFSDKTNQVWRLPTDEEWVRAAGDRFKEVILGDISNSTDPSKLWIRKYFDEANKRGTSDPNLRTIGTFGENNLGVADINGNIWEWTDTCFINGKVSADGNSLLDTKDYCGVRSAQGKHRAFIIEFVRDARSGGCAAGIPPDNLGFRLVRDTQEL